MERRGEAMRRAKSTAVKRRRSGRGAVNDENASVNAPAVQELAKGAGRLENETRAAGAASRRDDSIMSPTKKLRSR